LIFCRTKRGVSKLTEQVEMMGHRAAEIHSNRSLEQRRKALAGFKARKYRVLVATDIAARGLDVKDIELVINFDLPEDPGDYVHRVGRTGRAGKTGKAISFASPDQIRDVRQIERLIKKVLPLTKLAEFREAGGTGSSALRRRPARNFPRPFNKSGRHFAYQGAKKSGPSKFNGAASRPAGGFGKFKAKDVGFRSASGSGKFKPNRVAKGGFDPLRYFSNRPETRIMTDKERFRASLRDNDRPSFGRGKSRAGGNRPGRGFRR
jgi:superfamily II DNA/RNA helicase